MKLLRKILFPLAMLYWLVVFVRNLLYDFGILKSYSFDIPIIAVGNLSVGGTGKTPHIEYLIRLFSDRKMAVLSRGYGRKTKGFILASHNKENVGEKELISAQSIGDEPYQFYSKFPQISVAVDEDRKNGIEQLQKWINPDSILLDDAFQHRRVKADFYVLLTDYSRLFCDDFILPFGDLRESGFGKKRADAVVVTKCPEIITDEEKQQITKKLAVKVPVFFSKIVYDEFCYSENDKFVLNDYRDSILIVAGIANPKPFLNHLKPLASDTLIFPDHHNFTENDIVSILKKANGRKIITTEKDFMRLQGKIPAKQLYYLPIIVEIDRKKEFDRLFINVVK